MKILLTNDDGIFAPGLAAIYKELVKLGDVTVVAPAESRSAPATALHFTIRWYAIKSISTANSRVLASRAPLPTV